MKLEQLIEVVKTTLAKIDTMYLVHEYADNNDGYYCLIGNKENTLYNSYLAFVPTNEDNTEWDLETGIGTYCTIEKRGFGDIFPVRFIKDQLVVLGKPLKFSDLSEDTFHKYILNVENNLDKVTKLLIDYFTYHDKIGDIVNSATQDEYDEFGFFIGFNYIENNLNFDFNHEGYNILLEPVLNAGLVKNLQYVW